MCNITDSFSVYEALCQSDLRRITDFLSMIQQDRCAPCTPALKVTATKNCNFTSQIFFLLLEVFHIHYLL